MASRTLAAFLSCSAVSRWDTSRLLARLLRHTSHHTLAELVGSVGSGLTALDDFFAGAAGDAVAGAATGSASLSRFDLPSFVFRGFSGGTEPSPAGSDGTSFRRASSWAWTMEPSSQYLVDRRPPMDRHFRRDPSQGSFPCAWMRCVPCGLSSSAQPPTLVRKSNLSFIKDVFNFCNHGSFLEGVKCS